MTEDYGHPWLDDPQHDLEPHRDEDEHMANPRITNERLLAEVAWEQSWPEVPHKALGRPNELRDEAA